MSKFMFVIPTLSAGGAERVTSVLSGAIARRGAEVDIIRYYPVENEYPVSQAVKIISLFESADAYKQTSIVQRILLLRKHIRNEKPDYVIPFLFRVSFCTVAAASGLHSKVFQSMRIDPARSPADKKMRFFRDLLVYISPCTFVQNESQKRYFKPFAHKKIHVLFNPVSEKLFDVRPSFSNEKYTVSSLGRLEEQKNFTLLIDAFDAAFADKSDVQLKIYGEGSLHGSLSEYIKSKGLDGAVILAGRTNNVEDVYTNTDLFVLSSDCEGMPNALIEAMACALPCISTDCPTGPRDLITDKISGILVPVNNKESMANAIRDVYGNREKAVVMGQNAREEIKNKCGSDMIAKKMIAICESCRKGWKK